MSSKKLRSSRDSVLFKLAQKKAALEKSRLRLENEIKRIDYGLVQIQAEYGKVYNDVSPLLNLPTEVTCMIFNLAVASYSLQGRKTAGGEKSLLPEVVISHVCKPWRDVSLNYPRIWTKFFFRADGTGTLRNHLDRFDTYLKRSHPHNLELFLDVWKEPESINPALREEENKLFEMAFKHVERWKIVTLKSRPDLDIDCHFAGLGSAAAPNLEYLACSPSAPDSLYAQLFKPIIEDLDPTILKGGAPNLCYLFLDRSSVMLPPIFNITTLRLEAGDDDVSDVFFTWTAFLEILSLPFLTNLSLVGNTTMVQSPPMRIIHMNSLKHLRYRYHEFMKLMLPYIRAPLLETLSIRSDSGIPEEELGIKPFVVPDESYFFPSLHTLTLVDASPSSPESAWRMAQMTKNITNLLISHDDPDDNFIAGVQDHGRLTREFWPKLTTITASMGYWDDISLIVDFVRSRPKNTLKLRVFKDTHFAWSLQFTDDYKVIRARCKVEVLSPKEQAENPLMRPVWPPGMDCPGYSFDNDPFAVESPCDIGM